MRYSQKDALKWWFKEKALPLVCLVAFLYPISWAIGSDSPITQTIGTICLLLILGGTGLLLLFGIIGCLGRFSRPSR